MCWFIQDRALLKVQCGLWLMSSLNVPLKDYNLSGILTMLSLNLILLIFFLPIFFFGGGVYTFNVPIVVVSVSLSKYSTWSNP